MTIAELLLLVVGGTVLYLLLRPVQRWLEAYLIRRVFGRHPRGPRVIDVTEFRSDDSPRKEDRYR